MNATNVLVKRRVWGERRGRGREGGGCGEREGAGGVKEEGVGREKGQGGREGSK